MADITYIPIRQLHPHPDNPRKELGDLSELAASIKENGVYQNLTVIPGHYLSSREYISKCVDEGGDAAAAAAAWAPKVMWVGDDYTIIIGHRRAAAAQQAGLYELPCAIVEMDEREQMQTMMVENMQRSDLTVYEQAQGFQMMMDFGQTVEQISDKSGFSQSTVRRRIKLLELNHDSFKKAEKRGATLSDFAQLDKIEDLEARNRVLETLGTQNFNRAMQDALEQQNGSTKRPNGLSSSKIRRGRSAGHLPDTRTRKCVWQMGHKRKSSCRKMPTRLLMSIRSVKIRLTCTNLAIRKPRMPATRRGRPQEPPSSLRENSLPLLRSSCTSCDGTS